ncbi:hypothetical protein ABZ208_27875 [Streptomyces sp. NPDC006208]|uniref:hypothetical protein n=1 Tax=Streptomyces sp. NPDC006208 TaxID=3156734 RepID=UPI0033BAF49A
MATYQGRVSGFMPRTESGVFRKRQTLVWDFRLERHGDGGRPLPRVAVQMRAKFYRGGAINNGDVVQVSGRQRRNGLIVVDSVRNLTSGTVIRAHNWNVSVFLVYALMLLVTATVIGVARSFILSGSPLAP